jgi:hypothetical protein
MHAVSLTPQAHKNFRTTSKSENHMQNSVGMHDRRTIRTALSAFKGNIYQKLFKGDT